MGKSNKALTLALASCLAVTLTACGGSDSDPAPLSPTPTPSSGAGSPTPTPTPVNTGLIGPNEAHTIAITKSVSDAIEDLKGGVYRRIYKAMVTDAEGNAVTDGTPVYLNAIDSIMARGTISATNASITGSVLTDTSRAGTDDINNINFDSAYVIRNDDHHFIHEGSHLLLTKNSHAEDKIRTISSTAPQNQAITVSNSYGTNYPHTHPIIPNAHDDSEYVIGESLMGIEVGGIGADGKYSTGIAYTNEGIATFYVTYPANRKTANIGCTNPITLVDDRYEPANSAQPYLFAYVSDSVSAVEPTCFYAIGEGSLITFPDTLSGSGTLSITLYDGGDGFAVPFANVAAVAVPDAGASISFGGSSYSPTNSTYTTNEYGSFSATITVTGKGKVIFGYGETTVTVTVGS